MASGQATDKHRHLLSRSHSNWSLSSPNTQLWVRWHDFGNTSLHRFGDCKEARVLCVSLFSGILRIFVALSIPSEELYHVSKNVSKR